MSSEQKAVANSLEEKYFFEESKKALANLQKAKADATQQDVDKASINPQEHQRIQQAIKNVLTSAKR